MMADAFDPYHKWLGIPPKHQPPDHYRLLGIERFETDLDVISLAADQRMQYLRSLQSGERAKTSQQLLNEVAAARVCLLDAGAKAAYDRELAGQVDTESESSWPIDEGQGDDSGDAEFNWSRAEKSDPVATRRSLPSRGRRAPRRIITLALTLVIVGAGTTFVVKLNKAREVALQAELARREAAQQAARQAAAADRRAKQEAELKANAARQAKEETQRKAKEEADRKAVEEAGRKAKEEEERKAKKAQEKAKRKAEEDAKIEAERKANIEAEQRRKREEVRRVRQALEREANEAKYLRAWFERNFEQTKTGWAPVMREEMQDTHDKLKKSKNTLAKNLQQSQSLLRIRKRSLEALQTAEQAKKDFKPKKEAATSRIKRIKKITRDLETAQKNLDANKRKLKKKRAELATQQADFEQAFEACRSQNAEITALLAHSNTERFIKAHGLKLAPTGSRATFEAEMKKSEKLLERANEVQVELGGIE